MSMNSVLPDGLRARLNGLGSRLERQLPIGREFDGILDAISALPPGIVVRADSEIAHAANLQRRRRKYPLVVRLFSPRMADIDQLGRVPGLEFLFLFHRDGHIREAALRRLDTPIPSPFLFAAIAWRLNDWVAPVREAAAECAARCFPLTAPAIVAEAALTLLARENSWGRWTDERHVLRTAFARPDVAHCLAASIRTRRTGPMATILRYALREGGLDAHLETLARDAVQPSVRAVAAQALIDGHATWPDGWTWRWVDKSMGLRRRETLYRHRPLDHGAPRIPVIEASANDRSAIVRRVATSGLIRHEVDTLVARRIAMPLLRDRSPSVREQAEFILRTHRKDPA